MQYFQVSKTLLRKYRPLPQSGTGKGNGVTVIGFENSAFVLEMGAKDIDLYVDICIKLGLC